MKRSKKIAQHRKEWWEMVRDDYNQYELYCHPDDSMMLTEYVSEIKEIYGWKVIVGGMYEDIEIEKI